jgi:hypothetical protein
MTFKYVRFKPGLKKKFRNLLHLRFELKHLDDTFIEPEHYEVTIDYFNKFGIPLRSSVKRRQLAVVFSYHVLRNYRG